MLDVRVLGAIEAQVDGVTVTVGSQTQRALLAALVHARGRTVPVDRLAWLVWGDDPPAQAYNSLKSHLSRLRRTLGTDAIVARPPGYALDLEPDQLDVHRFEQGVRRARTVEQLDDVLSLWRGPPYGQLAGTSTSPVRSPTSESSGGMLVVDVPSCSPLRGATTRRLPDCRPSRPRTRSVSLSGSRC